MENTKAFWAGFAVGLLALLMTALFIVEPLAEQHAYREAFDGTVTVVQDEFIVNAETGKFVAYTSEWLEAHR